MTFSSYSAFKDLELLADVPGELFSQKTAIYERYLGPFCKIMDAQIQEGTILGKNDIFRKYTDVIRWPIRKLEYSFVLHHALPLLESGRHLRVLDAGCGATPLPHLFAMMGAEVDAVDFDEDVIETLKTARVNEVYGFPVNHQWMDLRRLAFCDSRFDIVTCVSVIEHLGNGDEELVLAEIMRVLDTGGKAILTTDVRGGDHDPLNYKDRRYGEPFYLRILDSLLAPYAQMLEGGLDQLKILSGLQDDVIESFWSSHGGPESTWQGNRGYVALGIVLSKPSTGHCKSLVRDRSAGKSREPDEEDYLLKSQIRRSIELERALEEKERLIRELDRALKEKRAGWVLQKPLQFLRNVWHHRANKRRDAKE